jgi:hypothetical protein
MITDAENFFIQFLIAITNNNDPEKLIVHSFGAIN